MNLYLKINKISDNMNIKNVSKEVKIMCAKFLNKDITPKEFYKWEISNKEKFNKDEEEDVNMTMVTGIAFMGLSCSPESWNDWRN